MRFKVTYSTQKTQNRKDPRLMFLRYNGCEITVHHDGPLQCIDLPALLETVQKRPIEERARAMMLATGCEFWPEHSRILRSPSARLAMVGGLAVASLVQAGLAPAQIAQMARRSAGAAASMAYLTVAGGSADSAYNKVGPRLLSACCAGLRGARRHFDGRRERAQWPTRLGASGALDAGAHTGPGLPRPNLYGRRHGGGCPAHAGCV